MILRLRWLWAGLAVLAVAGCASFKSSPSAPPSRPVSNIFHVVKPGENLFRIGKAYDVSVDELAKANRLKDEHITTEHIFLEMLSEHNTPAARLLEGAGLTHDRVYDAIQQMSG